MGSAPLTRTRRIPVARLVAGGCAVALALLLGGAGLELSRFGLTDEAAAAKVERDVRAAFVEMTRDVEGAARDVASDPEVSRAMGSDGSSDAATRTLFDAAARARQRIPEDIPLLAITIYDASGLARAWAGRASDLSPERTKGAAALFVTPSALGQRLVHLEPITSGTPERARLGSVAVEHVLTPAPAASMLLAPSAYVMPMDRASVSLRPHGSLDEGAVAPGVARFVITAPDTAPLLDGSLSLTELAAARTRLRRRAAAAAVGVIALTVLLLSGPLLDRRALARARRGELQLTLALMLVLLTGSGLLWAAFRVAHYGGPPAAAVTRTAFTLLLGGLTAAALAAAAAPLAVRARLANRHGRRSPTDDRARFVATQLACGLFLAALFVMFERVLGRSVDPAAVDLRHFSLHPWTVPRLATLCGILLAHAAALWTGALVAVATIAPWRLARRWSAWHVCAALLWVLPTVLVTALRAWPVPPAALVLGACASAAAALAATRLVVWYRHATAASRILALFLAFLLPALLVYPSVHFFAERSMRATIETRYAVQAMNYPQTLQDRLAQALREIDALPQLPALVATAAAIPAWTPRDTAFRIWSQTVLARDRLTSDVEIYDRSGALASRYALNFPEYTVNLSRETLSGCQWEVFGEAQAFVGAQERNMLHAQRSICDAGRPLGTIIVRVVFDHRTLPFISSQSTFFEVFSPSGTGSRIEGPPAGDVDFTVYGWGLTAIFNSGHDAWPLDEATFERVYKSRQPFWTEVRKSGIRYNVYFSNDRRFIYALGYPIPGVFDHLVRLAELTTLAAAGYVLILIGNALFTWIARTRPQTGRALLREIRASFYRKLFLAFVAASIVPVLTLAFVIRAYFAGLLLTDIKAEASRTAAVAQRVTEESDALLRRNNEALTGDDVMVWISQLIDQDVNVFEGPQLLATSERDLFASGLLPTRTPDDVYRAIVLQHLPTFVTQDTIGVVPYMLAATPVLRSGPAGEHTGVLTVPLAFRQQEVEREIDDLDRGVHLAALFFILLGAGIGLSMAERIADPIRQLTRATGRIARGEFDARIAVRSSDELRRLVDAFNGMAAELKAQRDQLERTHRLEAWAEMARQVAHEIKNPLTPIQLSAEHLRRVHLDRGEPMGPVLEGCVTSILGQVRLLRQIAGEFSSFASSPTARRSPADAAQLVHDVVEPYRAGLQGRIEIDNRVAPPLPAVLVDRTLVTRALANIIENALHAMPGQGRLDLGSRVEDGQVVVRIADTGVGMDEEALARVFEPYFSTKTTGTGLGLPIARRNIELSGGTIAVESEKGRGTAVTIRLPVVG